MRIFLSILITFICIQVATAQVLVTDRVVKQSISKVLNQWSDTYNIDFAFDSFELSQYSYSGQFEAMPLDAALKQLLGGTPFRFRWLGPACIIFPFADVGSAALNENRELNFVSGAVYDRLTGESLPFASVAAVKSETSTTADADGVFNLSRGLDFDTDTLVVVYLGYVARRFPFKWSEQNREFIVELIPAGTLLPDVEVRATSVKPILFESEASSFTVSPNLSGLRYGVGEADIFRAPQFAPGISAVQENNNGLFIRGSSSDQSQLMFDGFNIYHQDHFFGMFSALNAHAVKTMRILKCPTDPSVGGRAAGTIEVVGKEGDLRKSAGLIEMGTLSVSGLLETPLDTTGKASLFMCGRRSLTEWIKGPAYRELFKTLYSSSIVSENNEILENSSETFDPQLLFQDVNAKFTYKASSKNHFNVSFYASRDEMNFDYADTSSAEYINVTDIRYSDEATKSNRGIAGRWIHRVSPRLEAHSSIGFSSFQGIYFSTDSIRNNLFATDSTRFTYRDVLLQDLSASHRWQFRTRSHTLAWGAALNHIETNDKTRALSESEQIETNSGQAISFFIGDEWRSRRWMIKPGLRINYYKYRNASIFPEPKISARYALVPQVLFLKAAAARSVQFVQRITNQSLYQNVPDQWQLSGDAFPVMKADQAMAGLNWTPGAWNVDIEIYTKRTQGQVLNAMAGQYTNIGFEGFFTGLAYVQGIDAAVQWERPPHRCMASFTRIWAESNYDGFEQRQIQESYIRGAEGKLIYEWKKGDWNFSIVFIAAQGSPYTALLGTYNYELPDGSSSVFPLFGGYNQARTATYLRVDAALGYRWQWLAARWQLNASIYNVLDTPNYRAMQYSAIKTNMNELRINEREIRMLGRIPSINLSCQF